ncbi:hypothetical protein [Ferruginibacter sp.]
MNAFEITQPAITTPATGAKAVEILVFKTNITDSRRITEIESLLEVHPHIIQWNVDLDDCDNILRIVSRHITGPEVESLLLNAGFYCEELQ